MVIVFGSINIDIALSLARLPERGETVLGHGCVISPGGKGANQAHAARRAACGCGWTHIAGYSCELGTSRPSGDYIWSLIIFR